MMEANPFWVIPGDGLVHRSDRFLAWLADDGIGLIDLLAGAGDDVFKELGRVVLESDFAAPAMAVVDLERNAAFVYGSASLVTPDGTLDGSSSSTWLERSLDDGHGLAVNPDRGSADPVTDLLLGTVRGGGWALADAVLPDPASQPQIVESVEEPAAAPAPSPAPEPVDSSAPEAAPVVVDDAPPSELEFGEPVDLFGGAPMPTLSWEGHEEQAPNSVDVDLVVDSHDPFDADVTSVVRPPGEAALRPPDAAQSAGAPVRAPGTPRLRPAGSSAPEPAAEGARLRFDDGQELEIQRGVYVGRNPTKNGLPVGYTSVTIRGEHVSRLHWELDLTGQQAVVRDLGSSSGITLSAPGVETKEMEPGEMIAIAGPVRVDFADRWADIEL